MNAIDRSNQITGPNAGRPRQFPIRTPLAARVGQFGRLMRVAIMMLPLALGLAEAGVHGAEPFRTVHDADARAYLQALATNGLRADFLESITNLPASVRRELAGVADRGEWFSDGCIGGNRNRRFVAGTKTGRTYNVAIEQGGLVTSWFIRQFVVTREGKIFRETRIEPRRAANGSQPIRSATNQTSAADASRPSPGSLATLRNVK